MKNYSIKKINGEKTLIVNNVNPENVLELYKKSVNEKLTFALVGEDGILQYWGLFSVADYCKISDCSIIIN